MNRLVCLIALLAVCAIPITVLAQLEYIGSINTTDAHRINISDGVAGILDGANLLLYDLTYPYSPQFLSSLAIPGQPQGLDISGNYVYVAAVDSGVVVVDITTPTNPQIIGRFIDVYPTTDLIVNDTICYLMDYSLLTILNIAVPAAPLVITRFYVPMSHNDAMAFGDNMIYIVGDVGEFEFMYGIDVSNPAEPFRRSYGFDFWNVSDMIMEDNRLFITNPEWNYISTFSIANPDSITPLSVLSIQGPTAIIAVGGLFYVSRKDGGITELYCTDPDTCVVLDSVDTPGTSRDIADLDNYLFLADSNSVQIFWRFMDGVNSDISRPDSPDLLSNYPNPFNAQTTISFSIDKAGPVTLEIYDLLGRKVATLLDKQMPAGEHKVVWDTGEQVSGNYWYRIKTDEYSASKKCVLLK